MKSHVNQYPGLQKSYYVDVASESPPPWYALESQQYPRTYALLGRTFLCNCGGLVPTYEPSHRTSSCACEILPIATSRTWMPGCGYHFHRCQVGELELSTLRRGQSGTLNCEGAHREDEAAEVFLVFNTDLICNRGAGLIASSDSRY